MGEDMGGRREEVEEGWKWCVCVDKDKKRGGGGGKKDRTRARREQWNNGRGEECELDVIHSSALFD